MQKPITFVFNLDNKDNIIGDYIDLIELEGNHYCRELVIQDMK